MSNQVLVHEFILTETDNETIPLEIATRFNNSRVGPNGFFAHLDFAASFTGTIEIHLGPTYEKTEHIHELDMQITNDAGPHTFDIATRARYLKIVVQSGGAFNCTCTINR